VSNKEVMGLTGIRLAVNVPGCIVQYLQWLHLVQTTFLTTLGKLFTSMCLCHQVV